MRLEYEGKRPVIGKGVFIAQTAVIIGDVEIKDGANIWYGVVLRGDMGFIRIGKDTNIQDNCTVHTYKECPAIIGDRVSVGHNAVIHGCTIEDDCLIGINAVVLNGARVKTGSVVAAGAVVKEGQQVGPYHLVAGAPASIKRDLSKAPSERLQKAAQNYIRLSEQYLRIYGKDP